MIWGPCAVLPTHLMIGTWRLRETLAGSRPKPSFSDLSVRPIVKNY